MVFYGLTKRATRQIVTMQPEMAHLVEQRGYTYTQVFHSFEAAHGWLQDAPDTADLPQGPSSSRASARSNPTRSKHGCHRAKTSAPPPVWFGLRKQHQKKVVQKLSGRHTHSGWKLAETFTTEAKALAWISTTTDSDISPSSDSSNSDRDGSFTDEDKCNSESDDTPTRHRHTPVPSKPTARSRHNGKDPSIGKPDMISGHQIKDPSFRKALAPDDMRRKDVDGLLETTVDVTALPGVCSHCLNNEIEFFDEVQGMTDMATAMLATNLGKKAQLHDVQWKQPRKVALAKAKTRRYIQSLLEEVREAESPAFELQEDNIRAYLQNRNYREEEVEDCLGKGLIPRLSLLSFKHCTHLIDHIKQISDKHGVWEGGLAEATLLHCQKGLWKVRQHSPTHNTFILKMHIFLRDEADKSFFSPKMNEVLWRHQPGISARHPDTDEEPPKPGLTRCNACRSRVFHTLFGKEFTSAQCPFSGLGSNSSRREAVRKLLSALRDDATADKFKLLEASKLKSPRA